MMWRVLAAYDFVTITEIHFGVLFPTPSFGVSTGPHMALGAWAWKFDRRCLLGPIPLNSPPCLGHDAGVGRPHILVDPSLIPPPPAPPAVPANSAITSALATACSAMKPTFSSSRDLRNGGPGPLPVSTETLPFGAGIVLSGNVPCGIGPPHMGIPMVPTQLQDWSGLTLGDLIGGFVNMQVERFWQGVLETVGGFIPGGEVVAKAFTSVLAKTIAEAVVGSVLSLVVGYGPAAGVNFWPTGENVGRSVRNMIDGVDTEAVAKGEAPAPDSWPSTFNPFG